MLNITDIRIRVVKDDTGKLKAVASITIDDCFAVHDIKIISGSNGPFVAMPSRRTPDGEYKDIVHPINSAARDELSKRILDAYANIAIASIKTIQSPQEEVAAAEC